MNKLYGFWKEQDVAKITTTETKPKKKRRHKKNNRRKSHNYGQPTFNTLKQACLAKLDMPSNAPLVEIASALESGAAIIGGKRVARGIIRKHGMKLAGVGNQRKPRSNPNFYQSTEWRQLRYLALKNTGGACQCCGASARHGAVLHVDHIKPRSQYPELALSLDNIQVMCDDCNIGKGVWDHTDWRVH